MTYANGGANFQLDLKNMPMGRGAAVFAPIAVSHFLAWLVLERRDAEGVISRLLGTAATIANYSRIGDRYVKGTVRFLIPIAATATEFKPSEEQTSPSAS
jgi:hypothetical protein